MKHIFVSLGIALALLVSVSTLQAQSVDVTGGSITVTLDPAFLTVLSGQGVTTSISCPSGKGSSVPFFAAMFGGFDLSSGVGSISGEGTMAFQTAAGAMRIHNLMFENFGTYPVITGSYYLNGHFMGRNTVLTLISPNAVRTPMSVGPWMVSGMQASIAPYLSLMLSHSFGVTIPSTTPGGTVAINVGLVAVGN